MDPRGLARILSSAALAVVLSGFASPALAVTRTTIVRPVPAPAVRAPAYYPPPVYAPPVDFRAPSAAKLAGDQVLAEQTRDAVDQAIAANAAERARVLADPGDDAGTQREAATALRRAATTVARLDSIAGALEVARTALDARARRAADLQRSLYSRPVEEGKADADALDAELGRFVSAALQSVFDEARAELGDVFGMRAAPRFVWPEKAFEVSQPFGPSDLAGEPPFAGYAHFHLGVDLAAPEGTAVIAAADGVVVMVGTPTTVGQYMGFGNFVLVAHGGQVDTLYGHLDEALVRAGDVVRAGQEIGIEGSTGYSTGPHLHFETHVSGQPVDPAPFLPGR